MKAQILKALLTLYPEVPYDEKLSKAQWVGFKRVHIKREGWDEVYLQRFILLRCPLGAVYLHRFFRGDEDQCLHDHPWAFASLILKGGYWEETEGGKVTWCPPGSLRFMPATHKHRVILDDGRKGATWTLVATTKKTRSWGFWTLGGTTWVPWQEFIDGGSKGCE